MRIIILLFFLTSSSILFSQTQEDKQSNSFEPFTPQTTKAKQKQLKQKTTSKKPLRLRLFNKRMEDKKAAFYERMEENANRKKKIAKKMEKPQYSDPMYFGHKKKPKKRPPGKRKFCSECGIVH